MNFIRAFSGLSICLLLAAFSTIQSYIQLKNKNTVIILQDLSRITFLFIACIIKLIFSKTTLSNTLNFKILILMLIASLFDYLSILFLNIGFRISSGFLLYSIIQLIVPMDMIYLNKYEIRIIILFFGISIVTFIANYFSHKEKLNFKKLILGVFFGLLSNISLLICTYLQYHICLSIDLEIYYIYTTPIMILFGFLLSDFKKKQNIFEFYRKNFILLVLCGVFGALYYFLSLLYVIIYEPYYFNISILALTGFTGLLELPFRKKFHLFIFLISLLIICIGFFMLI